MINEYKITELYIGMKESFQFDVTEQKMKSFLEMTGDINPLHIDEEYAKVRGHSGRVVYGMLTASLISTLGGVFLPGKFCLIEGIDVKFVRPVFVGDHLIITGEVIKIEVGLRYLEVKVTIVNQNGKKVLRGVMKAGVQDEG